ncbi:MAG: hypothetical protein MZW92_09960 [Comamonadaceae bacterium]|nr:hypothetical protein [Comamonadaceae bacterium]
MVDQSPAQRLAPVHPGHLHQGHGRHPRPLQRRPARPSSWASGPATSPSTRPAAGCEECKGAGVQVVEMQFLSDVSLVCDACKGRRFKKEILEVRWNGRTIDEVLGLSVTEACLVLRRAARDHEEALSPASRSASATSSSASRRRPSPAASCSASSWPITSSTRRAARSSTCSTSRRSASTPTTSPSCCGPSRGSSPRATPSWSSSTTSTSIKSADHVIDLGPEGGEAGGRVVAQGTPEKVAQSRRFDHREIPQGSPRPDERQAAKTTVL